MVHILARRRGSEIEELRVPFGTELAHVAFGMFLHSKQEFLWIHNALLNEDEIICPNVFNEV